MRSLRFALLAAIPIMAAASTASAQQVQQLPRIAPTTGLADSTLLLCTDSTKTLTRACKFSDVQKRLAFKAFDSLVAGNVRVTGTCSGCGGTTVTDSVRAVTFDSVRATRLIPIDSIRFNGTTNAILGGAASMSIQAGTGNSRTLTLKTTTSAGTAKNTLVLGADTSTTFLGRMFPIDGTATVPSIGFGGSTTGFYRSGTLVGFVSNGSEKWRLGSGAITPVSDGVGDLGSTGLRFANIYASTLVRSADGSASAPSFAFNGFATTGIYGGGSAQVCTAIGGVASTCFAGGAAATITGGAGNMTITAGTGNSRAMALQTTTSAGTAKNTLVLGADSSTTALGKMVVADTIHGSRPIVVTTAAPSTVQLWAVPAGGASTNPNGITLSNGGAVSSAQLAVTGSSAGQFTTGDSANATVLGNTGSGPVQLAVASTVKLTVSAAGGTTLLGAAGNMTILAGTGNARTLTLRSSSSSGTATTFASGSGDTLLLAGHAIATGLTAAAGTPGSLCYNTATSEITKNNALTCTVSARRFKHDIADLSLTEAKRIVMGFRTRTFTYNDGSRRSIGGVAEEVDSVDTRLTFRDEKGRLTSVDYQALGPILVKLVQDQQRQLDSLKIVSFGSVNGYYRRDGQWRRVVNGRDAGPITDAQADSIRRVARRRD